MLFFNARNNNQGFTLAETVVIAVVIGILAAIAIPSFLGWLNRKKVEDAVVQVQGALQEAQREAMKRSRACAVTIPNGSNQTVTGTCLLNNRELDDVNIRRTNAVSSITFNFRGGTGNSGTIVLSGPNTPAQGCLVLSAGIGLMRSGDYRNADTTGIDSDNCTTSQQ